MQQALTERIVIPNGVYARIKFKNIIIMKNVGIWLDKKMAKIVSLGNGIEKLDCIESEVEDFHVSGGSGTKIKGGPQDVVQDSKYLEREKHQLKSYFKKIAEKIKTADQILILGPAQTYAKFEKELNEKYKKIASKVTAVHNTDSMTDNQLKSVIRSHFLTE